MRGMSIGERVIVKGWRRATTDHAIAVGRDAVEQDHPAQLIQAGDHIAIGRALL